MKLNDNERKVLAILRSDPFTSQKSIAKQLDVSRPSVANVISGLQEKGEILGKPYLLRTREYVTCIGGANFDYTFRLDDQLMMHTSNPVRSNISYGGVVRNIAENLVRLTNEVALMTLVGEDASGRELLSNMGDMMDVSPSEMLDKQSTGGYYSVISKDGNMDVGFADMSINDLMDREWILSHKRYLNMSSLLIADTNMKKEALESLIEFANEEEKKLVIVGVSGPKMKHVPRELTGVELMICNLDESQAYFHTDEVNPEKHIALWRNAGVRKIVITLGKEGVIFGQAQSVKQIDSWLVKNEDIVDVTGAGDAFSAAVVDGILQDKTLEISVKYGIVNASLTIQSSHSVHKGLSRKLLEKEFDRYEKR